MKNTYYVLARIIWCGECDDFVIEKIVHVNRNAPFEKEEIYDYINLDYIRNDEDKSVKEYSEGNILYYYINDIDYDFDPDCDSLAEALALYKVYCYQQTESTGENNEI